MMTESKTTVSQGGTHPAYHVEVRSPYGVKSMMGEHYGQEWSRFIPEQTCIPASPMYRLDRQFGLMTYAEAQSVAWMVCAYCDSMHELNASGMEVRIVESAVTYSYDATRTREFPPLPHRPEPPEEPRGKHDGQS